eukprot:5697282-Prorocentrum_lima.AAC.1
MLPKWWGLTLGGSGCHCHEEMLKECTTWQQRKQRMLVATGGRYATCPWQGKRGPEFAMGRRSVICHDIKNA